MWSTKRLPDELTPTDYAKRLERRRKEVGVEAIDLTLSNPTRVFPDHRRAMAEHWVEAASAAGSREYAPVALGLPEARRAVAGYYEGHGVEQPADRIVLTASTSEAYTWLAKLFADPGGEVLIPAPSYPLFEHLMRLESVETVPYDYRFDGRWHLDVGHLQRQVESADNPRAIIAVSPNNPTGHVMSRAEYDVFADICAAHALPLVVDEVFLDYGLDEPAPSSAATKLAEDDRIALAVLLGGLSKSAALPGAKIGWMALRGADAPVEEARERLEFVADTFLSSSTASQLLAARVLGELGDFHRDVRRRTRSNLSLLREAFESLSACDVRPAEAGWYGVVRAPEFIDAAECTVDLLGEREVLVQPGFFYDFRAGSHLVISLLPAPDTFERGIDRVVDMLRDRLS